MAKDNASFLLLSSRVTDETSYQERRSSLAYDYVTYFERLGFTVIPVPCNTARVDHYFQIEPKAVVLTGGNTVPNRTPDGTCEDFPGVFVERDHVENQLIDAAISLRIPLLGICRGMQMINRYFGGRVRHGIQEHVGRVHRLHASSCESLDGEVTNSFHGDGLAVEDVAQGLRIIAVSDDNIVEALAHENHTILGVQWHPERQQQPFDDLIINQLLRKQKCP